MFDAVEGVVLRQPSLPEVQQKAVLHPRLKAVVRRGAWTKPGGQKYVPRATGAKDKEDAVRAGALWHPGPPATETMGVLMFRQEGLQQGPMLIADDEPPTRGGDLRLALGRVRGFGSGVCTRQPTTKPVIRIGSKRVPSWSKRWSATSPSRASRLTKASRAKPELPRANSWAVICTSPPSQRPPRKKRLRARRFPLAHRTDVHLVWPVPPALQGGRETVRSAYQFHDTPP